MRTIRAKKQIAERGAAGAMARLFKKRTRKQIDPLIDPIAGLLAAFVLAPMLAGCFDGGPEATEPAAPLAPPAIDEALERALNGTGGPHDHADASQHPAAGWDLEPRASVRVQFDGVDQPLGQFTVHGDLSYVAMNRGGLAIIDISEPSSPRMVGGWRLAGNALVNDAEVSPDGRFAFLAAENVDSTFLSEPTDPSRYRVPMMGIIILDVSDPEMPILAGHYPSPQTLGYHRVDLIEISGDLYVLATAYVADQLAGLDSCVDILRFLPEVGQLEPISHYDCPGAHEAFATMDPLDGRPIMVTAEWTTGGVALVDLSVPSNPQTLGRWWVPDAGPQWESGMNAHEAQVFDVEGRRIVAVAPELYHAPAAPPFWLVDFTDPARPEVVGTWSLPGNHPFESTNSERASMTPDAAVYHEGRLWVTHHHGGLLVFNVSTMNHVRAPRLEAWLLPPSTENAMGFNEWFATPMVYDVFVRGNDVFFNDITGSTFFSASWSPGAGSWPAPVKSP